MGRYVRWSVIVLVLIGLAVLVWYKTRPKPIELLVKPVVRGQVEKTVANTRAGTVNACRRAKLSPSIGGQIAHLPIREGDKVKAGALLLEIWNEDLKAQLTLAEREVEVADARAHSICISAAEASRQARREEQLFQSKIRSEEQADRATSQSKSLQAECTAARAAVLQGKARVEVARVNLSRTRLVAPFDGVIAEIEGELNEYVTPSPVGVQTPPAVDLIENNCYYISAPIDEVDASAVKVGMKSRITLDAFRDKEFAGNVRRISPYVLDLEKQARTVEIEASFADTKDFDGLLAGYSADVEIIIATRPDTLKVPTEAVIDGRKVFIFSRLEQVVQEKEINKGLSNWVFTEVISGLQEGELVVTNVDKPGLKDGVRAILLEETP